MVATALSLLPPAATIAADPAAIPHMLADPRFGRLGDEHKRELLARVAFCQRVDAAPVKKAALRAEALRTHAGVSLSFGGLRKLYYERWLAGGRDWWEMRNEARMESDTPALPAEFTAFWRQLCFRFGGKRRHKAAHRELERLWRAGTAIPGVAPEHPRRRAGDLPMGMSYRNLTRKRYRPTPLADTVAGIGLKAAYAHLPGMLSTRAGLPFGSRYVFDDAKHDFMVSVTGQYGMRELWQFHCLELLSGYQVARGYKPAMLNLQTDRMEKLRERELLFLLAHLLCEKGYNGDGCILMMEAGTATVRGDIDDRLFNFSNGKILVQRGTTSTGALAKGLYGGQSGGNPRFKAAIESITNLIHIETSDRLLLPAQTGGNSRIDRPEEMVGREHHLTQLQKCALLLPAEVRDLITRTIAPPVWQAIEFAEALQERMNWREDHELEGWEKCGFILPQWRLMEDQDFEPQTSLAALAPEERAMIERRLMANPKLTRTRRLSPGEVFTGYAPLLTKLPPHALPGLIGMEHAQERKIAKDGDFHFEDEELGPDQHHYQGEVVDGEGRRARLAAGEKYATFVSAINPHLMHLCNAKGGYVGYVERQALPTKADAHGYARMAGRRMAAHRDLLAPVLAAARPLWKRQTDGAAVTDTVFAQQLARGEAPKPTPVQRAQQKRSATINAEIAAAARASNSTEPAVGSLYDTESDS